MTITVNKMMTVLALCKLLVHLIIILVIIIISIIIIVIITMMIIIIIFFFNCSKDTEIQKNTETLKGKRTTHLKLKCNVTKENL